MKLRIIAGTLKRRTITISGQAERFRPTKDMVREAVADSLLYKIVGAYIADVCAGSGAFGFEMVSRGAHAVCFVESDKIRSESIRQHSTTFGILQQCRFYTGDVRNFILSARERYDIIYYDPPYEDESLKSHIDGLLSLLKPDGILVYEHEGDACSFDRDVFASRTKRYGRTTVDFISRSMPEKSE